MNRKEIWKKQGEYKSLNTGKPMILATDKTTGATTLEPLAKEYYTETKKDIETANDTITKRTRYDCGLSGEWINSTSKDGKPLARTFFVSPDSQNGELFYELKALGYRASGYEAEYHWTVSKNGVYVEYVEGDLYITTK